MSYIDRVRLVAAIGAAVVIGAVGSVGIGYAQAESHEDFVCLSGSVRRVVSVINHDAAEGSRDGGCRVDYTKNGETRTVWSSKNGHAYCAAKAAALVTQLIEGRFSCKPETDDKPEESAPSDLPPGADEARH